MIYKASKAISDAAHFGFYRFGMYIAMKWRIFRVKRKFMIFAAFFGGIWWGYYFSGIGKNLYTTGYQNGWFQPFDYSLALMNQYGGDEKFKYNMQLTTLIKEGLDT